MLFLLAYIHNFVPMEECLEGAAGLTPLTFNELPDRTRALLARLNFGEAEKSCLRNLPIGRLMREDLEILT